MSVSSRRRKKRDVPRTKSKKVLGKKRSKPKKKPDLKLPKNKKKGKKTETEAYIEPGREGTAAGATVKRKTKKGSVSVGVSGYKPKKQKAGGTVSVGVSRRIGKKKKRKSPKKFD